MNDRSEEASVRSTSEGSDDESKVIIEEDSNEEESESEDEESGSEDEDKIGDSTPKAVASLRIGDDENSQDADQSGEDGASDDEGLPDGFVMSPMMVAAARRPTIIAYAEDSDEPEDIAGVAVVPIVLDGNLSLDFEMVSSDAREPGEDDASDIGRGGDDASPLQNNNSIQWPVDLPSPSPRPFKRVLSSGESPPRKFSMTDRVTSSGSDHDTTVHVNIPPIEPLVRRKPQIPDRAAYFQAPRRR